MGLTAFVSGASGFVGSHLVRELHKQGWVIHILARPASSLTEIDGIPVTVHIGDVVDAESVKTALPAAVDAVFHVAASTNLWSRNNPAQTRVNVEGTNNMIDHTSSFVTWGFQDRVLTEETARVDTVDWVNYVRTKHQAENLVLEAVEHHRLDAAIMNPANVLGPGDWHNWSRLIRLIHQGKLPGAPPGGGSFCDVRQVARAHVKAFHEAGSGERYLLGGDYAALVDVIGLVGELLDKPVPEKAIPAWMFRTWAHIISAAAVITGKEPAVTPEAAVMASHNIICDSSKAQRELDYGFTPIRALLRDTVDWMNDKGLLQ
jgi:nucleoside-diphosphate-sugar epimerase